MSNSRIPKSYLKASKLETAPKPLVAIPENVPLPTASTISKLPPSLRNPMRRRSKSVTDLKSLTSKSTTDLRSLASKPLATVTKTSREKVIAALKPGQKRPALLKSEEVTKPKVAKVKIPDWDYKSRFHDLQGKYTAQQEELKRRKDRLEELQGFGEEIEALRSDNLKKQTEIELLQSSRANLEKENKTLHKNYLDVKASLTEIERAHEVLTSQHSYLMEENKKTLMKLKELQEGINEKDIELICLRRRCEALENSVKELKAELENQENLRRIQHNTIQDLKGNIRVFCRVRPPVNREEINKQLCSVFFPDETSIEIRKSRESVSTTGGKPTDLKQEFTFDRVFPPEATQTEVFEELSQLVQSALDGYHICVFAYGQTGSGKTYTMQGSSQNHGMIPRTVNLIFEKIDKLKHTDWNYAVTASFLEIYNESVRDLLDPTSAYNCDLKYNEGKGVIVTNLKNVPIGSAAELMMLMEEALNNRAVARTDFNEHSSRSHAVTKIDLVGSNSTSKITYIGSIHLVDLAGSESAKTSASDRLTETKNINKSLSALGNVMLALHNKDPHVPYRNSKLTFLLQTCLGGNSKTLMFTNISPFEECYMETINSLRFAAKVKDVKTNVKRNRAFC